MTEPEPDPVEPVRGLFTVAEGLTALRARDLTAAGNPDWATMAEVIDAVTPVIEDMTGAILESEIVEERDGGRVSVLLGQRAMSVVSVVVDGRVLDPSEYRVIRQAGVIRSASVFPAGVGNVVVTYMAGVPADQVPANVKLAAIEQFRFLWQWGRAAPRPQQIGGGPPDYSYSPSGYAVPNRVAELLGPNPRLPGFA